MFHIAIIIGVYSYIIFLLGIIGLLTKEILLSVSFLYSLFCFIVFRKHLPRLVYPRIDTWKHFVEKNKLFSLGIVILIVQASVNLLGVLGPEYAFDALWYHLTIPKLFLLEQKIYFIPGGLLYYSAMPKFTEMFYIVGLVFSNEIAAKCIHYSFGILSVIALYKLSRTYFNKIIAILISVIFYSNLVVAWESTTAYVDLTRTFYEILALYAFMTWKTNNKNVWFLLSAIMLGFAITTKLIAVGSLIVFLLLIFLVLRKRKSLKTQCIYAFLYLIVALSVPLPWFIFAFINTGNPVYPIFSGYPIHYNTLIASPLFFLRELFHVFTNADDPISPIYVLSLPLILLWFKKFRSDVRIITFYSLFAILIWYFTPRTGGGRFILPYLPAFSILVGEVVWLSRKNLFLTKVLIVSIFTVASITILYRGYANSRNIPVILGKESKQGFLVNHLNFNFGDFYDIDGNFANTIKEDTVLLYGFHNVYYLDRKFIHNTWVKKGDSFTYVATQHADLPHRFRNWKLVYENDRTGVKLYTFDGKTVQY